MATTYARARRGSVAGAIALLAALLALAPSHASQATESERLTQGSVKRFIASYPEVKTIAISQAAAKGRKIAGSSDNALLAVVEAASDDSIKGEIEGAARRHGFRDGKEWFGVARSVGVAYAHMKAGPVDAKAQQKLEKAIAKVEDMPLLSDKQKKKLVDGLRKGAEVALEPPPPENVAVVKAMAPQIEAVVK